MNDHPYLGTGHLLTADLAAAANPRVLAVGDPVTWRESCGQIPSYRDLSFCGIDDVNGDLLGLLRPSLVVSPVVTAMFDCIDLAMRLQSVRFNGAFRALARDLPRPEIIRLEVMTHCPAIDFDIIPLVGRNDRPI